MLMDHLQRVCASLTFLGEDLNPEELSELLGCTPEVGVRKGDAFVGGFGRPRTAPSGRWTYSTGYREPPDIDDQICELLGRLPESLNLWSDLTTKFECYLSLGIWFVDEDWTSGTLVQPSTLPMLGERGVALDFDMYAPAASN